MGTNLVFLIGMIVGLGLQVRIARAETNSLYITDDRTNFYGETNLFTEERIEKARQAKESRPSEVDKEGNWGPIVEGFQLSIRLYKQVYTNGEPIQVKVILRNVSGVDLKYRVRYRPASDFSFIVKRDGVLVFPNQNPHATNFLQKLATVKAGSSAVYSCPAWTQREDATNLRNLHPLNLKGDYTVVVKRQVPTKDGQHSKELSSGVALFRIE